MALELSNSTATIKHINPREIARRLRQMERDAINQEARSFGLPIGGAA